MTLARPLIIAHRGARSLAPENTLLAAQKALKIGADLWELDVAMTSDGEIVVLHDDTLKRTSNAPQVFPDRKPWNVDAFSMAELHQLDFGSWFLQKDPFQQIQAGNIPTEELKTFVGLPIPTLSDALTFTRQHDWRVNIEIKDLTGKPGDPVIVEQVASQVTELGMEENVFISSFNHTYLQRLKAVNPCLKTAALVEKPDLDPLGLLKRLSAAAYNPNADTLQMDQIKEVVKQGYQVFIWTVNDEDRMRGLIAAGASGLFTDFPQRMKAVIAKK